MTFYTIDSFTWIYVMNVVVSMEFKLNHVKYIVSVVREMSDAKCI